ncbi:MAG: L-2-amino-thiazoline-4-carboxylic acid hydrolase [Candidatus Bathyarchaeota archaeon]|nr:MAG: L-2-amino-thiazoline-4-carboxylic acid hydrolase [Candidatus Bathyarchaeota archaeon]
MVEEGHKFREKLETTYEDFYRGIYGELVQAVRMLQEEFGEEKVLEAIRRRRSDAARRWVEEATREEEPVERFRDFSSSYFKRFAENLRNHQTYTVEEDSEDRMRYKMTECIWAKAFRDLKAGDIGYAWLCHSDYAYAEAFHPSIRLERGKTLMQGDDCCDFDYTWDEKRGS